jgi:hypothetical protein
VREENSFILKLVDLGRFGEFELNHALKFTKEGLSHEILRLIIVAVAVNETFVLE